MMPKVTSEKRLRVTWFGFCFLRLVTPPGGAGAASAPLRVSHVPVPGRLIVQVNLLSVRGLGPAQVAVCNLVEQKRDGVKWHHLQNGLFETKERNVRSNTPKVASWREENRWGGLVQREEDGWGDQPSTSAGTISLSFSGVVWPVASRHRSTASRRAAATAHFRRAAPRAIPATRARTGG